MCCDAVLLVIYVNLKIWNRVDDDDAIDDDHLKYQTH